MNDEYKESEVKEETNEEITFEETNEEGEVDIRDTVKKLRQKIKLLEKEKQEYLDLSQRTKADYINFKKEVEEKRADDRKYATRRFIEDIIPVLDAYDGARNNTQAWEAVDANWRIGIEYIFGQLLSVLEKENVTRYGNVGDAFDPLLHETLESIKVTDEQLNDTVVKVLQSGYKLHDYILRPARVHVGVIEK
ncbi:MAG: hypothetical protein RI935_57 [Candidatus Parcubacteria bacterium]|jgi:molecular chaperone GrpE